MLRFVSFAFVVGCSTNSATPDAASNDSGVDGPGMQDAAPCKPIAWTSAPNLPVARESQAAVGAGNLLVVTGGFGSGGASVATLTAEVMNGTYTSFAAGPAMPGAREHHAMSTDGSLVVVSGGDDGAALRGEVFVAKVAGSTLGSWTAQTSLPAPPRLDHASVIAGGRVYVLGGSSSFGGASIATVSSAPIDSNGTIGAWSDTAALPAPRSSPSAIVIGNEIVVASAQDVWIAPVTSSGVGAWKSTSPNAQGATGLGLVESNGTLWAIGGIDPSALMPSGLDTVRTATVGSNGVSTWAAAASLPARRFAHSTAIAGATIFVLGGFEMLGSAQSTVYSARVCER